MRAGIHTGVRAAHQRISRRATERLDRCMEDYEFRRNATDRIGSQVRCSGEAKRETGVNSDIMLARDLRTREESHLRYECRSCAESMADLLADEFVEFGNSGRMIDRGSAIDVAAAGAPFHFRIDAFAVHRLAAQVALTTYRLSAWPESESAAKITLRSSVWVYRVGRWQMIFYQGTVAKPEGSE